MPDNVVGRNDPCPCGSGKKYKKCCLRKKPSPGQKIKVAPKTQPETLEVAYQDLIEDTERLDQLSNGALDAIKAGRYQEAERLCKELLRDYPDVIDGHDRLGMLREAQGRFQEAADCCAKALVMIEKDAGDYDPEVAERFRQRRQAALARAKPKE